MMSSPFRIQLWHAVLFCLSATAGAQPVPAQPTPGATLVSAVAKGTVQVSLMPQPVSEGAAGSAIGRMSIDKQFAGDLVGTGQGEMPAALSTVKGSAGDVALEKVAVTLGGRTGTFVLQHSGTMSRGSPTLAITTVPDPGSESLAGISGSLSIDIVEGRHYDTFSYSLPE